ncbi:MAG: hypothetical protein L0H53_08735 [Candidatus Nitrosocosmicus sp.]|nr:hypothetical protein [Candidatus Nitrosocosmicus sp.]MDN5868125.1 hypothetical protein [Candidatus Nitrosocosmicus sp.]
MPSSSGSDVARDRLLTLGRAVAESRVPLIAVVDTMTPIEAKTYVILIEL